MSIEIDWSKAPEGYSLWVTDDRGVISPGFHREEKDRYVDPDGGYWLKSLGGFTVYSREDEVWNGTGLPPVGTVCEHQGKADDNEWLRVKILAHTVSHSQDVAVFQYDDTVSFSSAKYFRPIRTPDQIAAEEREKAILEMVKDSGSPAACLHPMPAIFGRLYDAGYRKTEAGK